MLARLHLVRHGEVHNPGGVVYSDLPGFPLSALGRLQAEQAAEHLAACGAVVVATSPLSRAVETAGFIGRRLGRDPEGHPGLTEWGLSLRWAGTEWARLEERFPGELAQYFAHPHDLPFSPESLGEAAARMSAVVAELGDAHPGAAAVVVSHQDPIQALRTALLAREWSAFHEDKPTHASVISLERHAGSWIETGHWQPDGTKPFPPPPEQLSADS